MIQATILAMFFDMGQEHEYTGARLDKWGLA